MLDLVERHTGFMGSMTSGRPFCLSVGRLNRRIWPDLKEYIIHHQRGKILRRKNAIIHENTI